MINEGQPTEETKEFLKQQGYRIKKARLEPKYGKQIALTGGYVMLEYFGLVRKYYQAKHELTFEDLELFFYLYPKSFFTKTDYNNYPLSWGSKRFNNFIERGFIHKITKSRVKGAVYGLTQKTKAIVRDFHRTLAGEINIPNQSFYNPLLRKDASAYQKTTIKIMKEMREAIQKSYGYEDID